jgi:methyl-accepting chemotaxis protein
LIALFDSRTIKARVIAAFAKVLFVTVGLGILSIQKLSAVNDQAAIIRDGWLPSTRALGDVFIMTERVRTGELAYALARSADEKQTLEKYLSNAFADRDKAWSVYEPLITAGAERQLADDYRRHWDEYVQGDRKVMALIQDFPCGK